MFKIKNQIRKLYASSILGNLSLTGAWVAILASRGFSLVEIGLAETCYHIASLLTEIPSGTLADVYGRKRMLMISTVIHILSCGVMILSRSLPLVCLSIALIAVSDSFASGSGDALSFDSLKSVRQEQTYDRYESSQLIIYRLCSGISTLCAGFALIIGYRIAYATGIVTCGIQLAVLATLKEIRAEDGEPREKAPSGWKALLNCFRDSLRFLRKEMKAFLLMMTNSLIGAADILLLFFLQAKLPAAGIPEGWLGPALFVMELGGILGEADPEIQKARLPGGFRGFRLPDSGGDSAGAYRPSGGNDCRRVYRGDGGRRPAGAHEYPLAVHVPLGAAGDPDFHRELHVLHHHDGALSAGGILLLRLVKEMRGPAISFLYRKPKCAIV